MKRDKLYFLNETELNSIRGGFKTREVGWIYKDGEPIKVVFIYDWDTGEMTLLTGDKLQGGHTSVDVYA
jgi:hypothetical protein